MDKIAVVGGGISGLSVAKMLHQEHYVVIFEKEDIPGGLIKCKRINGSLFHTCGGHVFKSKKEYVLDWFWRIFSQEDEFSKADRNSVVFMEKGGEIPYPIENHMYLFDADVQKHFIDDLIAIGRHDRVNPSNFEEFLRGRFGDTLYKIYFQPYNEKVWRRDLKQVPLSWLEGKLPMPTVQEMIFNNINHIKEKAFVHSTFWYEKENGSQYIANKLAEGLDIRYNTNITAIDYDGIKWHVANEEFDRVIFCGNIKDLVNMIHGINIDGYKTEIEALEYHGTTVAFCEIDKNPYSWIYQPSREHESHRIICTGNFSKTNNSPLMNPNRITATIEFTDEISKEGILDNLKKIPLHPKYLTHEYNQYTYPIQDANTRDMIKELKRWMAPFGFYFTGRFADWEYYNMDVAIDAAMKTIKLIDSNKI